MTNQPKSHTMTAYCEMFCEPNTTPTPEAGPDWNNACPECKKLVRWLSHDVLPTIRRQGYYSPTGSTVEQELAAVVGQEGMQDYLNTFVSKFLTED